MTSEPGEWGPRLYAYLERYWHSVGTTGHAWSLSHGITYGTVSRWQTGVEPRLPTLRQVADALGAPLVDLLLVAGVIDRREINREVATPEPTTVDVAIKTDPNLTDLQRRTLAEMLGALRDVEGERRDTARGRTRRKS